MEPLKGNSLGPIVSPIEFIDTAYEISSGDDVYWRLPKSSRTLVCSVL